MTIRIVTDSTCDLPPEVVREHCVTVTPVLIHLGTQDLRDGIDFTREEFYARLPSLRPVPTTAAPGHDFFRRTYEQLAAEGATQILSIHISRRLSATVDIARQAASRTKAVPVTVFDSRQLSLGTGFAVYSAARAVESGMPLAAVLSLLEAQVMRTHVFAALDTLEYLRRSGRMNGAISALGEVLQIKPVLKMFNGEPTSERVRTRRHAIKRLKELLAEHAPYERVAVLHSGVEDRARSLLEEVLHDLPDDQVWLQEINPVLGAHIGPGALGFACVSAEKQH
jgi:DegV family protein with EDD domain